MQLQKQAQGTQLPCAGRACKLAAPLRSVGAHRAQRDAHVFMLPTSNSRVMGSASAVPSSQRDVSARTAMLERPALTESSIKTTRPLEVAIAGGGIGGLLLAVGLLKKGMKVSVFERDLTAIRGEGKYRGPIQVQSNALAALEAIDTELADEVMAEGCITGDRINGLCDGVTGDWYIKFDTFHPAVDKGLPVTRVISRVTLQQILTRAVIRLGGEQVISNSSNVVNYEEFTDAATGEERVRVLLEDGRTQEADLLVGADGIWSKVRRNLVGESAPSYSGYTCYTGISDFTPPDLEIVGYRVFLGNGQYFVSSDVGGGKQQWYGFHKEPAGGSDEEGTRKERLLKIFGHWCDQVVDLIKATPEDDVLRRDIYDRPPIFTWHKGRVVLLGDSAHAMQPNLGQGGCMAIEDAFQLAVDLAGAMGRAQGVPSAVDMDAVLREYESQRMMRASTIHGMAGMAAIMASTYKAYLGEGLGPLEGPLKELHIPHPGRVTGQLVLHLTMPAVLQWVLGGNNSLLEQARPGQCRLSDKLKVFSEQDFARFMHNDEELLRAAHARWMLLAERPPADPAADPCSCSDAKGVYLSEEAATVGGASTSSSGEAQLLVDCASAAAQHAKAWRDPGSKDYFLQHVSSSSGTWHNARRLSPGETVRLMPGDTLEFGQHPSPEPFKVKMQHISLHCSQLSGVHYTQIQSSALGRADAAAEARAAPVAA